MRIPVVAAAGVVIPAGPLGQNQPRSIAAECRSARKPVQPRSSRAYPSAGALLRDPDYDAAGDRSSHLGSAIMQRGRFFPRRTVRGRLPGARLQVLAGSGRIA